MNHVIYQPWFITAPGNYIDNKCNMKTKLRNIVVPTLCPRSLAPLIFSNLLYKIVKIFKDFESTGHPIEDSAKNLYHLKMKFRIISAYIFVYILAHF